MKDKIANSYLQICNVLVMELALIKVTVIPKLEFAFVMKDFKETSVKVCNIFLQLTYVRQNLKEKSYPIIDISYTPCPTGYDSYYQLIDNKCFYFEKENLNHNEAQTNCMEKLKNYGGGKLFEPKSLLENEKVAYIGYGILGDSDKWSNTWLHIGITDNVLEGTWAYESDGSNITFVPNWQYEYNDHYFNCITINAVQNGQGSWTGEWVAQSCTSYYTYYDYYDSDYYDYMSICESLLKK